MCFAIFAGFGPILMVFIDQNMPIHDFSVPGRNFDRHFDDFEANFVQQSWKLFFFEKLLRHDVKFVFL